VARLPSVLMPAGHVTWGGGFAAVYLPPGHLQVSTLNFMMRSPLHHTAATQAERTHRVMLVAAAGQYRTMAQQSHC
jgi:hypothetical protein